MLCFECGCADAGEPGLADVNILLLNSVGAVVASGQRVGQASGDSEIVLALASAVAPLTRTVASQHTGECVAIDNRRIAQVAKLAGMPSPVLHHARHTLASLEERAGEDDVQVDLFAAPPEPEGPGTSPVEAALAAINPDALSPREALDALYQLKRLTGSAG